MYKAKKNKTSSQSYWTKLIQEVSENHKQNTLEPSRVTYQIEPERKSIKYDTWGTVNQYLFHQKRG